MPSPVAGTPSYGYQTVNNLLGYTMDPDVFNAFAAAAQVTRELAREWMVLKAKDTTQTSAPTDTFLTPKAMPASFLKYVEKNPIQLVDSLTAPQLINYYTERPFEMQNDMKDDPSAFYADYANAQFYLCGKVDRNYYIQQHYVKKPADVFYDASGAGLHVSWVFPAWASNVLWFDIAAMNRLGADYDDLNARMGDENAQRAEQIFVAMIRWDARLSKGSVQNMDIRRQAGYRNRAIDIYGED